jgi:pimeloyl-ACP methyl ester carboxylesterase
MASSTRNYRSGAVTSADGTTIGYKVTGDGPAVVLVQGAMGTAFNYDELARALADTFTVYVPDRRGRGMSPLPYTPAHSIQRDIEDIGAVVAESGARCIFGLSSGAIITLAATNALASIEKAAIFEPPFVPDGISHRLIRRFNTEVQDGRLAAALVTVSRIVKLGPRLLGFVPRPLLQLGLRAMLKREARRVSGSYSSLQELIPAMLYDFNVVGSMDGKASSFSGLQKEVLLLGGSRSPAYLKAALKNLKTVLPNAKRIQFKGLDHSGPWNADRGGNPGPVAEALRAFFPS